jgi:hypothetical protein
MLRADDPDRVGRRGIRRRRAVCALHYKVIIDNEPPLVKRRPVTACRDQTRAA